MKNMNNIWGQLLRETPVPELKASVSQRRSLGNELQEACAHRRPRGFRAEKVKPTKPHDAATINQKVATTANPWKLTSQQYVVIAMLSQGASRHAVAEELHICYKTLNIHLNRVRAKMGVRKVEGAVAEWLRVNLNRDLEQRRQRANEMLLFKLRKLGIKP